MTTTVFGLSADQHLSPSWSTATDVHLTVLTVIT